ncbi:hypothetical protein T484DRAFT_1879527 [Baffinella frigidus]|nr:hypothetical protein T484DRAFT_1879527 [Cryptophyta sp. CCMP2293]
MAPPRGSFRPSSAGALEAYRNTYSGTRVPGEKSEPEVDIKPMSPDEPRRASRPCSPARVVRHSEHRAQISLSAQQPRHYASAARAGTAEPEIPGIERLPLSTREFLRDNYPVAHPREDPIAYGTFAERQGRAYPLFLKPPQFPAHEEDGTGVFNAAPVRRYYTTNMVFYGHHRGDKGDLITSSSLRNPLQKRRGFY